MLKGVLGRFFRDNLKIILLVLAGTISWSLTMVKSGLIYPFGMGFWGANGHDGIWHVSLINSLARGSFQMPVFAGENLKNYHIGFDLAVAFIHNLTRISTINLYFQIIPPLLAVLVGVSCYLFMNRWTKSARASLWATFFVYFGGDLAWIFGKGESTFWSQQSISTLINPPFAMSLVFIFLGLYFLLKKKTLLAIFFLGLLLETKAYAGVLVLGSLFVAGLSEAWREKKYNILTIFAGSSVVSFVLFLILNNGFENLFVFSPFWFLQSLFNLDRFSIPRFASAIANYNLAHNFLKLGPAYVVAFAIFWVGNMGTRLFKEVEVFRMVKNWKSVNGIDVFLTTMILAGGVIPMLFVQKGTPWNTIQFFYYSLIFSAIVAGVGVERLMKNKPKKFVTILSILIVVVTIPTTIITLKNVYIPGRPPAKVSNEELSALHFLSQQEKGVVLTYPYDSAKAKEAESNPPRPLYLYDSTAYVSAFGNHLTYLEDEVNLNITNFDWRGRRLLIEEFLNTLDQNLARKFLKENNIAYVYWVKPQRAKLGELQIGLKSIFENTEVNIFKVE